MDLAIQILDGAPFRPGDKLLMSVSRAKFEQKGEHRCTLVQVVSYLTCLWVKKQVFPIPGFGFYNISYWLSLFSHRGEIYN